MIVRTAAALLALFLTGCPRLPPPAPRPHVRLLAIDGAGELLTARLAVGAEPPLVPVAVDWALAIGQRDLARGRSGSLEIAIPRPAAVRAGMLVRLRGAVHLQSRSGAALAPFDEIARVR